MRHGVWIEAATWLAQTPEQRHAALVHATDLLSRAPGEHVFALESASAVWGLPNVDSFPDHVSRLATGPRTRGSRLIKVHVGATAEAVVAHGLLVTDVPCTLVDLARTVRSRVARLPPTTP